MRHAYRCHAPLDPPALDGAPPNRREEAYCVDSPGLLDTVRCPCCRAPLAARLGRDGPYFHCRCHESKKSAQSSPTSATPCACPDRAAGEVNWTGLTRAAISRISPNCPIREIGP